MALINAFGALALDQSVMCTTPLLKQIDADLKATPYVYVVNYPSNGIQNIYVTSTPIVQLANTQVTVQNWPSIYPTQGVVNVNVANAATPPVTQNVNIINASTPLWVQLYGQTATPVLTRETTTPITYAYQPYPYSVTISSTPIVTAQFANNVINIGSTPTVYAYQPYPYLVTGSVSVSNFPVTQNVVVTSTPIVYSYQPFPYNVVVTSTPVVLAQFANNVINIGSTPTTYAYQPYPYTVQGTLSIANFPANQQVNFGLATPAVTAYQGNANWNVAITTTPVVAAYISNIQPTQVAAGEGRTLLFAPINTATPSTPIINNTAGGSQKIKVVSYVIVAGNTLSVSFQSWIGYTSGVNLTGPMPLSMNGGISAISQASSHVLETAPGAALWLNLSTPPITSPVSGHISYFYE